MIIYATRETVERYKLVMPQDMRTELKEPSLQVLSYEQGDRLLEWGAKLFYFDRRKCLQVSNFASRLTLFLFDIKVDDIFNVANAMANYMFDIYEDNAQMTALLEKFFAEHPIVVFSRLVDKKTIASLNRTQIDFAYDGYRFFDFIENNVLQTRKINRKINFEFPFSEKVGTRYEYYYSGVKFEELLKKRYGIE